MFPAPSSHSSVAQQRLRHCEYAPGRPHLRSRKGSLVPKAHVVSDKPRTETRTQQSQQQELQHSHDVHSLSSSPNITSSSTSHTGHASSTRSNVVPFRRTSAQPAPSTSSCPFLQAMREPPLVKIPWWQRVWQVTAPFKLQSMILDEAVQDGHSMVQLQKQLAFEDAFVPASGAAVRAVLAGDGGSEPISGPSLVPFFVRLMGEDSLLVVSGPQHKYLRGLLAPAFSPEAVSRYTPQIAQLVTRHLADWAAAGPQGVRGMEAIKLLTFEFIVELTLGRAYSPDELHSLHSTYQQWINGLPAWPWLNIPFTPYAAALQAHEVMVGHFQKAVAAGRARLAAGEAVAGLLGDMLAAVDDCGNRLSDSQITDNILLLLLAGHDTSSSTLTQCFSNLQDHPAVLQRLREEQQAVAAKHGEQITTAALRDMHYAEAVIRETLRRDPVVQMLFRVALRDFELSGYSVPAGKQLLLPLKYLSAHDPRWEDATGEWSPDAFVPERMLTPEGLKAGDLMPFGYGSRYCLGSGLAMAEMKVLLALVARHYCFTADNNTEWVHTISKVPKNGLPLVVTPLKG